MSFLEFKNVSKSFPGVKALNEINFSVQKGIVHVLIGENGAGKSTLIKILTGVTTPDEGSEIWIDGKNAHISSPVEALNQGIVAIYQDFSLFDNLSVQENIALGLQITKERKVINWKQLKEQAKVAMQKVRLEAKPDELVANISVAKKQLVAIARALVYDVKVLIMDEPTSCLSQGEVKQLFEIIRELKEDGITIIFVSHKMEEIFEVGDVVSVLRDGQYIGSYDKDSIMVDQLIELMVGRKIIYETYQKRKFHKSLLKVENLTKRANFKNISFKLYKGEILGFTGLVGAGRTEMVQALFGLNKPDSGSICLHGEYISINSPVDAIRNKIGYVPENRLLEGLIQTQSIKRNLNIVILKELKKGLLLSNTAKDKSAKKWMEKLAIRPIIPEMLVGKLSGGNQQRVVIAKWLAAQPEILIVDEPTNGIDVGAKEEIHRLLRQLSESGMSIIVVSSELPEVISICDRILIMKNGKIVAEMGEDVTQEMILNKAVL